MCKPLIYWNTSDGVLSTDPWDKNPSSVEAKGRPGGSQSDLCPLKTLFYEILPIFIRVIVTSSVGEEPVKRILQFNWEILNYCCFIPLNLWDETTAEVGNEYKEGGC